jgi:tetratricopeptide (TPR) repeat protein
MEPDSLRNAVQESCELANRGEDRRALRVLDDAIAIAVLAKFDGWVITLARHACVIADHAGDIDLSKRYCERILTLNPEECSALYHLADILHRQGENSGARQYAEKAYRVSLNRGGKTGVAMVELLLHRWPDLARSGKGGNGGPKNSGEEI